MCILGFVLSGFHNLGPQTEHFNFENIKPFLADTVVSNVVLPVIIRKRDIGIAFPATTSRV